MKSHRIGQHPLATINYTTVYGRRTTVTTTTRKGHLQTLAATFVWFVLTLVALTASENLAMASSQDYHDWSAKCTVNTCAYLNVSLAGTITGSSSKFWDDPGTFGVPYAITPDNLFTNEFSANGNFVGSSVTFNFSSGYNWGSGGQMLIGNIHNCFKYTVSAWDFNNQPIDVFANWNFIAEYQSNAPGSQGYFSTSPTIRSLNPDQVSEDFSVDDATADPNSGQGGVVQLEGLRNVAKLQVTLTNNNLCKNEQDSDFILFNVATPLTGPLSTMMNTLGSQKEVNEFYLGFDKHIYELYWNGSWNYLDLTNTVAGAPTAAASTAIASQIDELYDGSEVFYVDNAQHVHELYYDYSKTAWYHTDVTALTGAPLPAAGTPLVSLVNPYAKSIQVDYLDSSGHIHEVYSWDRKNWYTGDLTASTGAPAAAPNSSLVTEINKEANSVEIYFLGTDRHVRELWWELTWAPGWHSSDPTAAAGAPNAATGSALVSLNNPIANTVQVDYLGTDQHVHELWWNGAWHTDDLSAITNAPIAATGSSLATEVNTLSTPNRVELYYIANDQTVQELWFSPSPWGWNYADPSGSAGAPNATVGSPLVSLVNTIANSVQVHYIGADDHVHEVYTWDWTKWFTGDVNLDSNDPNNAVP